ncbi:hypothetical protein [Brevibacillus laterosporus]|uniref:hypothetical protein n=1 Tax=Brevibacillus laterosporus TaxID=1465 RepID=UPI00215C7B69|nr:hypothetical protein [Brevibacillus laterosporus]MCR8996182.1 hypothetical protein [Brevibacillus laterosporus]
MKKHPKTNRTLIKYGSAFYLFQFYQLAEITEPAGATWVNVKVAAAGAIFSNSTSRFIVRLSPLE